MADQYALFKNLFRLDPDTLKSECLVSACGKRLNISTDWHLKRHINQCHKQLAEELELTDATVYSVKIKNLKIPRTFIMDRSSSSSVNRNMSAESSLRRPLILDCEYEMNSKECGFVLKWYFNKKLIYQWIPARKPVAMNEFRDILDTTYPMSESFGYKYRALVIPNPTSLNISGEYVCSVQTFESFDKKSANLQVVVPETLLNLRYENNLIMPRIVWMKCTVYLVYPEPNLILIVSGNLLLVSLKTITVSDQNGMVNKTIYAKIDKQLLISPTTITCILTIPNSSYVTKRELIYYDQNYYWTKMHKINDAERYMSTSSSIIPPNSSKLTAIFVISFLISNIYYF